MNLNTDDGGKTADATGTVALPGMEHPPVHPKCRVFNGRRINNYANQLKAAGDTVALAQLDQAMTAATSGLPATRWN